MHTASRRGRIWTLLSIFFLSISAVHLCQVDFRTWGQHDAWCLGSQLEEDQLVGERGNPTGPGAVREMAPRHLPTGKAWSLPAKEQHSLPQDIPLHDRTWGWASQFQKKWGIPICSIPTASAELGHRDVGVLGSWNSDAHDTSPFCPSTQSHLIQPLSPDASNAVHIPPAGVYLPLCTSSLSLFLSNHISLCFFLSLFREWCNIRC